MTFRNLFTFVTIMFCLASCKPDRTSPVLHGEELLAELNRCSDKEDWSRMLYLLRRSGNLTNQVFMNYACLALAHRGVLADSCFYYHPLGPGALLVGNAETREVYMLQSDVYYEMGLIAASQRCAFEAMTVEASLDPDPQCLKRLVKTNLIYGEHRVARKYLNVLNGIEGQQAWVASYQPLVEDDAAVAADAELGGKRLGLSQGQDRFSMFYGWEPEIRDVIRSNPKDHTAVEYLGLSYLLSKNMEKFGTFLDEFYGTEALPRLPISFQQGVIALYQQHQERWADYGLSEEVMRRYAEYRDTYFQYQDSPDLKRQLYGRFGDTFWYYLMFAQ